MLAACVAAAEDWDWELPLGFPPPLVPADNPMSAAKVELGRSLFFDRRLSGNGTFSCASCHRPELAFTDGRARAVGATGELHPRSAMSLANVAYNATLTWSDPELERLEEQLLTPMFGTSPVELGLEPGGEGLLDRLSEDAETRAAFAAAYGSPAVTLERVQKALASFQRTLISGDSAYDRLVFADDREALSESARRGMRLFFDERVGCFKCHAGFNFSGPVRYVGGPDPEPAFHNTGLYDFAAPDAAPLAASGLADTGLAAHTGRRRHTGRFRAPTLRNVALTAPYMHDGSIASLEEVVRHYAAGGRAGPHTRFKSDMVTGFEVDDGQVADLVAFLESLTDDEFLSDSRFSSPD